jgi:hypothetical protein
MAACWTTERYLHTLPDADETALDVFAKIRSRASPAAVGGYWELPAGG